MDLNKKSLQAQLDPASDSTVYVGHIHDEASLKVKSFIPDPSTRPRRLARGRATKVQVNLVHIGGLTWKELFHVYFVVYNMSANQWMFLRVCVCVRTRVRPGLSAQLDIHHVEA